MSKVMFCIDSEGVQNPELVGLAKNDFLNIEWLDIYSNANEFRNDVGRADKETEIWVYSSDNVDAINIAATVKAERSDLVVCLISFDLTGSLKSRATAAGIDVILGKRSFAERFYARNNSSNTKKLTAVQKVPSNVPENKSGKRAFILPVMSATGGAGKSTVAIISAMLCQASGLNTLLLDGDLQFGDILEKFEDNKYHRIDEVLADSSLLEDIFSSEQIPAIIGCPTLPEYAEKVMGELPAILEHLSYKFDVIVINTGSFWGEEHAYLLERSSSCLMLLGQKPSSIQATRKATDLFARCGIATGSLIYALNFCDKKALYSSIDISCALNGATVAEIRDGNIEVDELISAKQVSGLLKEKNAAVMSIWSVLEQLVPDLKNKKSQNANNSKHRQRKMKIRKRA